MIRRLALPALAVCLLSVASCSSSTKSTAAPATTTARPAAAANQAPYAKMGPYRVGVRHTKLPDGRDLVIWYPTDPRDTVGATQETFDLSSLLTKELQAKIPAQDRPIQKSPAFVDTSVAVSGAPYPVVLFSHGFAGYPEQSVTLTIHLASWGMVVVAPDHVERSLDGLLGGRAAGIPKATDSAVLLASLDYIEAQGRTEGSPFKGMIDDTKVAVTGHSAGANAAYTLASNPRITTWISYSTGFGDRESGPAPPAPAKAGMLMLGTRDGIIPPAATEQLYAHTNAPKYLVRVAGGGHLVFTDICQIGKDKGGVVTLARQLKLGIPDELLKLGSDGCGKGYTSSVAAYPAIEQLSVAFLRHEFGVDKTPKGLDDAAVKALGGDVTVVGTVR